MLSVRYDQVDRNLSALSVVAPVESPAHPCFQSVFRRLSIFEACTKAFQWVHQSLVIGRLSKIIYLFRFLSLQSVSVAKSIGLSVSGCRLLWRTSASDTQVANRCALTQKFWLKIMINKLVWSEGIWMVEKRAVENGCEQSGTVGRVSGFRWISYFAFPNGSLFHSPAFSFIRRERRPKPIIHSK